MALTSWKQFPFFSVSQVPVPADEDGSYVLDVRLDYGSHRFMSDRVSRVLSRSLQELNPSSSGPLTEQCAFFRTP